MTLALQKGPRRARRAPPGPTAARPVRAAARHLLLAACLACACASALVVTVEEWAAWHAVDRSETASVDKVRVAATRRCLSEIGRPRAREIESVRNTLRCFARNQVVPKAVGRCCEQRTLLTADVCRGYCRRLMQPLPGWDIPDWFRSDAATTCGLPLDISVLKLGILSILPICWILVGFH
jgi:hypothetical protein